MKNLNLLNLVGREESYEQTRKGRYTLDSIVSRFCLASLICLCMLTVGVGNAWGDAIKTSDLDFGTAAVSVNFNSLSTTSISAAGSAKYSNGSMSGFTPFTHYYMGTNGNGAQSIAIAESSGAMTSNHMALVITNNGVATSFDHSFKTKGAFSFKVLKTSTVNIGIYTQDAYASGSTYFSHNSSAVMLQCTSSKISVSAGQNSGTPKNWQTVTESLPSEDVLEIHVIYNNTGTGATYGDDISIGANSVHVYINGTAVMDGDAPLSLYIKGNTLSSFRICGQTASTSAKVDDIHIYDALPGAGKTVSSIALKTSATKTGYVAGEDFAPAGMVITATYSDDSKEDIDYDSNSAKFSFSPSTNLSAGTTSVTVTYSGKTCTQTIGVYGVTISMVGEDETTVLTGAGIPSAPTRTGASIDADNTTLYGFKKWVISGADLSSAATTKGNTITNPTGAVTLKAVYNAPRTVTWMVNGEEWKPYTDTGEGTDGTAAVQHGKAWKNLTLPTAPTTGDACGNKFMGWINEAISGSLDKTDDAAAITTLNGKIMTSANQSTKTGAGYYINGNITFYAVFADYAE